MISPVTFGAGPSAAPARSSPDDLLLKRLAALSRASSAGADVGASRVDISPEAVQQSQADEQARVQRQQDQAAAAADTGHAASTQGKAAPAAPAPEGIAAPANVALTSTDLAFAVADANQDGMVSVAEQQSYEAHHLRITIPPAAEGRQGAAPSSPIQAYLVVGGQIAGT